jgi:PadR family transcriptional regulator, regulatory protein PadR
MPRRKPGALLPIEVDILEAGLSSRRDDNDEFHGFELARQIAGSRGGRRLTAHGTLYKALGRLEDAGLLASRWEEEELATQEGRPRRRLYTVTGEGARRLAAWHQREGVVPSRIQPGWQGGT